MDKIIQQKKAKEFLSLHHREQLLILPNIWDPLGARILEAEGYPAAATASSAISSSLGYHDEEKIKLSTHLEIISRITHTVDIPVSVDFEGGYAEILTELEGSIIQVIEAGAAGINIEDSTNDGSIIREADEQCKRIAQVRKTAAATGLDLVINARIDFFLVNPGKAKEEIIKETVRRAKAYLDAGADCVFPVGITDLEILTQLRKNISSPINVICSPLSESLTVLQSIGINRVSFGPFIFRSCMKKFQNIIRELHNFGDNKCFSREIFNRKEIGKYLRNKKE